MKSPDIPVLSAEERAEPLLQALLERYRSSQRGRTGKSTRDFSIPYDKLVHEIADVSVAEQKRGDAILARLRDAGILRWTTKPYGRDRIQSLFIIAKEEARFFAALGASAPADERQALVASLKRHLHALDGTPYAAGWGQYLIEAMDDAANGRAIEGLPNTHKAMEEVIRGMAAVARNTEPVSLRRLGAAQLNDSKLLARRRDSIERLMMEFLPPDLVTLEAWQVTDTMPTVRLFGPLSVELPDGVFAGELSSACPYALSEQALAQALRLTTSATRCISIENQDTFQDAVASGCRDLLIQTSYPSRSVVRLLQALPHSVPLYHWGDTDPWGFDILRVLRIRTGRDVKALHMDYRPAAGQLLSRRETAMLARLLAEPLLQEVRPALETMQRAGNKGRFEQESLPKDTLSPGK